MYAEIARMTRQAWLEIKSWHVGACVIKACGSLCHKKHVGACVIKACGSLCHKKHVGACVIIKRVGAYVIKSRVQEPCFLLSMT